MSNMNRFKNQRGFTMLEVLFSMVVLSIALLATARMHALVTQDGGFAKVRAVAANLAQEKLDDLKSFTHLTDGTTTDDTNAATTSNYCGQGTFCFSEIATGSVSAPYGGGQENNDGTLKIASGNVTIHNTIYNRTWTLTNHDSVTGLGDYYRCGTSAPSTSNCDSPNTKAYPDFKVVEITVAWNDGQAPNNCVGTLATTYNRCVVMRTTIHASPLTAEANSLAAPYNGSGPKVSYRPIGVPDAVPVPLNVGGNQQKETSKPLPDVSTSGKSKLVTFSVVTYDTNQSLGDGTFNTLRREEFFTVNCICKYANGTSSNLTASRMVWDGSELVTEIGGSATKATATAHTSGPNSDPDQPAECNRCCAQHHDAAGTDHAKFDPERPSTDYYTSGNASGDHKHYWWTTVGTPADGLTVVDGAADRIYLEACRFSRVNGINYLWQDWQMVDMTAFDYLYLQNADNLAAYQTYLGNKIKYEVRTDGGITETDPAKPTGRDFTIFQGELRQILGRAVYLDKIYQKDSPTQLDQDYYNAIDAKITAGEDWLLHVPFYEANLTLLVDWSSSNNTNVPVTMQKVDTIVDPATNYYGSYSRGRVTGAVAGTTANITVRALTSNSGLTSGVYADTGVNCPATAANCISYGIDLQDNSTTESDSIAVSVANASSTVAISGIITKGTTGNILPSITMTATSTAGSASCGAVSVTGSQASYTCDVSVGWSGTLTPSKSGFVFDTVAGDGSTVGSRNYSNVTAGDTGEDYLICQSSCPNP